MLKYFHDFPIFFLLKNEETNIKYMERNGDIASFFSRYLKVNLNSEYFLQENYLSELELSERQPSSSGNYITVTIYNNNEL